MALDEIITNSPELKELIEGMPPDIQARISMKKISSGVRLIHKDEALDSVYIFYSGKMVVINEFENGHVFRFSEVRSLSIIGEVEFLANEEWAACTVEAITECAFLRLSRNDFEKWFYHDPHLSHFLARSIAKKLYPTSYRNGETVFYPGIYQIGMFLVRAYQNGHAAINESRQEIAEKAGISIRTVNRSIKSLKEQGLILVEKGMIHVSPSQFEALKKYMEYLKFQE